MTYPTDHAGLEVLPFDTCLGLLASVPVGRIGFVSDGELVILPVNHLMDGRHVVFRTAAGSKLSAAENGGLVAFEADSYDDLDRSGWSVVVSGFAEVIDDDAETGRLSSLGLHPWSTAIEHPFWIRIRPVSVSGRRTPGALAVAHGRSSCLRAGRRLPSGGSARLGSSCALDQRGRSAGAAWFQMTGLEQSLDDPAAVGD